MSDTDNEVFAELNRIKGTLSEALDTFHFREALKQAMEIARLGNRYLQETEPWKLAKTDMTRTGTILNVALQLCANLAIAFEPFIPFSTERLAKMLNLGKLSWDMLGQTELVAEGSEIAPAELLFDKIEDAEVQNQVQKLLDTKKANEIAAWKAQPQAETVEFDTFAACDLRVGTVVECEKVPKADKLLRFHRRRPGKTHHRLRHRQILQTGRSRRQTGMLHSQSRPAQAQGHCFRRHDSLG